MSHTKAVDKWKDCIFRYTNQGGNECCDNLGYETSDECLKWFGLNPYFNPVIKDGKIQHNGGFIMGSGAVKHCRSCKYYCTDINVFKKRVDELKKRIKNK